MKKRFVRGTCNEKYGANRNVDEGNRCRDSEAIKNYRERVRQCDALGEFAMAEHIREILLQEQEHQIDLATALGIPFPTSNTNS